MNQKVARDYFDLWKANLDQLLHTGIERKNIEMAMRCTCHNSDLFFLLPAIKKELQEDFCAGITLL